MTPNLSEMGISEEELTEKKTVKQDSDNNKSKEKADSDPSNRRVKEVDINGVKVTVSSVECRPKNEKGEEIAADRAIVFLPGWSLAEDDPSVKGLAQSLADHSGKKAFTIETRADKIVPDSLKVQAEALRQTIQDLKEVTIVGFSQGGHEAGYLAAALQEMNPDVDLKGLILMDPVGLYDQGKFNLVKSFARDMMVDTPKALIQYLLQDAKLDKADIKTLKTAVSASADIVKGISREAGLSRFDYMRKFGSQVSEMASQNKGFEKVTCPVVLVQGENDLVSTPERTAPKAGVAKVQDQIVDDGVTVDPREVFVRATIFQNSESVKMVTGKKAGVHGMPFFRSERVARGSLYMLERQGREEHAASKAKTEALVAQFKQNAELLKGVDGTVATEKADGFLREQIAGLGKIFKEKEGMIPALVPSALRNISEGLLAAFARNTQLAQAY